MCTRLFGKSKKYKIQDKLASVPDNGSRRPKPARPSSFFPPGGPKRESKEEQKNKETTVIDSDVKITDEVTIVDEVVTKPEEVEPDSNIYEAPDQTEKDVTKDELTEDTPQGPDISTKVTTDTQDDGSTEDDTGTNGTSIDSEPSEISIEEERRPGVIPLPVNFDENSIDDIEKHPKASE